MKSEVDAGKRKGDNMQKSALLFRAFLGALILIAPSSTWAVELKEGVEQLATQLAKSAPEGKQLRVAVTDFPDLQEVVSELGRYVAERLTTRLSQDPTFWVIERRRLGQLLGELRFGMSDLVDPAKAKQLGKMVGVEAIVVGSISDLGNQVDLYARMIEIETGRLLSGASVTISKDQIVAELLRRGPVVSAPGGMMTPSPPGAAKAVSMEGFVFEARGCRRTSGQFFCVVALINAGEEERELTLNGGDWNKPSSQLIDNRGNQYPTAIRIRGRPTNNYLHEKFVPKVPVNVIFSPYEVRRRGDEPTWGDVHEAATHMTVVIGIDGFKKSPVLRDIPISN